MRKNPISKNEIARVEELIEDINCGRLEKEHPLQRHGGGIWSTEQMSNLIRRTLHDGNFLPILICTQYDKNGCEVRFLIDGLQRITTFENFMQDGFAISKNTIDYLVSYDGVLYETKQLKSGKFALKRDRNKNLIPILDEDGKKQRVEQTIDIRGLRYSDLPPELQTKIKRYNVSVQYKLECSDEDIQIEILDYNSGTKMNDAQIGKNRLGTEFARIVTELSKHSFIKNKCGFTHDNRIKGVIDRAINESLMLVNFGVDEWVSSHKDLCRKLSTWLTTEHTDKMRNMFDDLDLIIEEDDDIKDCLTLKEFFVVMANYKHFLDSDYKKECYAMFLKDFVKKLSLEKNIPTGEVDDDGNDIYGSFKTVYMTGTKQKGSIEERLKKMNEMLDLYLVTECEGMINDDEEYEEDCGELNTYISEFISTGLPHANKETALKSLIGFIPSATNNFTEENLSKFENELKNGLLSETSADTIGEAMVDSVINAESLSECIKKSNTYDMFSANDIAILIKVIKDAIEVNDDMDDDDFSNWLSSFNNDTNIEEDGLSASIIHKQSVFQQSINNFINERNGI